MNLESVRKYIIKKIISLFKNKTKFIKFFTGNVKLESLQ